MKQLCNENFLKLIRNKMKVWPNKNNRDIFLIKKNHKDIQMQSFLKIKLTEKMGNLYESHVYRRKLF